ncbi:MAG: SDR family NAD(P)-dependent oxidoreductase [Alphaproteobacteria bacterium]
MTGQRLSGKVAVVTGAAGGIGRAIAERFASEGAAVIAADLNLAGAEETAAGIAGAGGRAAGCRCDVSKAADAEAAVALAVARYGRLDVLVNNAAMFIADGTVADIPEEDWTRTLAVNLTGPFLMSKYAIPAMRAAGGGSIIHMGSQLGSTAKAGRTWYCAAKAGVIHLARTMAVDHADDNIRVNSLSPGPISTERIYRRYGGMDEANARSGSLTLLHRLGRPEEIADAALFLASDESSFMTGSDMLVDGGYNAR